MLCRPLLHAMLAADMAAAYGVEIDAIKCQKAAAFLAQTRAELARRGALPPGFTDTPEVSCSAIEQVKCFCNCPFSRLSPGKRVCPAGLLPFQHLTSCLAERTAAVLNDEYLLMLYAVSNVVTGADAGPGDARVLLLGGRAGRRQARLRPPGGRLPPAAGMLHGRFTLPCRPD